MRFLVLFLFLSQPVWAWWDTGHKAVAQIALQSMKASTRERVLELLKHHPDPSVRTLEDAAVWPDLIRDRDHFFHSKHHSSWHYQNRPVGSNPLSRPTQGSLLTELPRQSEKLNDPSLSMKQRALALSWVVHLVGDIHQPLHCAALYDENFPEGDSGGNRYCVWLGDQHLNLHNVWDSAGCRFLSPVSTNRLAGFVSHAMQQNPVSSFPTQARSLNPYTWSLEGVELCRSIVYKGIEPEVELTGDYLRKTLETTEKQIVLSGYRLAWLLDQSLANPAPEEQRDRPARRRRPHGQGTGSDQF